MGGRRFTLVTILIGFPSNISNLLNYVGLTKFSRI